MAEKPHVVVVGTGAMGAAAAYHLALQGARVTGLDRFPAGHDRGSSHGETRLIRKAYFEHPDYVPLLTRAYELWDELASAWGRPLFHRPGVVILGKDDSSVIQGIRHSVDVHRLHVREWSAKKAVTHFSAQTGHVCFAAPPDHVAIFEPDAGYLEVEESVRAHHVLAEKAGATMRSCVAVLDWQTKADGIHVALCEDNEEGNSTCETIVADRLILTPGAWAPDLLKLPHVSLKVHRVTQFWFPERQGAAQQPCFGFDFDDGFYYGFPGIGGWQKVACHAPGAEVGNPLEVDRSECSADRKAIESFVDRALPEVSTDVARSAVCLYTMTEDENFVLDHHPETDRVVIGAGFSGHGFKFASVIGEILAELSVCGTTRHPAGFLGTGRLSKKDRSL